MDKFVLVTKRTIFLYLFIPIAIIELFRKQILSIGIINDLNVNTFLTDNSIIFIFILFTWIVSMLILYIKVFNSIGGDQY